MNDKDEALSIGGLSINISRSGSMIPTKRPPNINTSFKDYDNSRPASVFDNDFD